MINKLNDTGEFPLGAELEFMRRLWRLNRSLALVSSGLEKHLGITAKQRMIIRCIGRYPGMTAGQLSKELYLDPGTVSSMLGRLEAKGLVQRHHDSRDKRRVTLGLTANGRALNVPQEGTVESAVAEFLKMQDGDTLELAVSVIENLTMCLEKSIRT